MKLDAVQVEATVGASKSVLVTGASGFIGYHIVEALNSYGYDVHTLGRKRQCSAQHLRCDLTAPSADAQLTGILSARRWYGIVHLAGLVSYSPTDSSAMEAINVDATRLLLKAAIAHCSDAKFIYCSSVVAVGSNKRASDPLINETHPWEAALNSIAYARTKRAAEDLVRDAGRSGAIATACMCPSNVFGARDGLKSSRKSQTRAANGRMRIYTGGGVSVVHVSIVARAFVNCLAVDVEDRDVWAGSRWLLTGDNVSVQDMLTLFSRAGGNASYPPWLRLPDWLLWLLCIVGQLFGSRSLTIDRFTLASRFSWYDGSRARQRFGLESIPATETIADSVQWMKENGMVRARTQ